MLNSVLTKLTIIVMLLVLSTSSSSAYLTYSGKPRIVWNGDPFTSTSGRLYCEGSIMFTCCQVWGTRIFIFDYNIWADVKQSIPEINDGENAYSEHFFEDAER